MDIRIILAPVTGSEAGRPTLDAAFAVAATFDAHLEGLHARRNARDALAYIGDGMTGAMIEELITTAEHESALLAERARADFTAACEARGYVETTAVGTEVARSARLRVETGREEELIAQRGRVADMLVIARPRKEAEVPARTTLEAAMLESGRPLFMAPPDGRIGALDNAAIAWNGSFEAGLAVIHALPFLARAQRVTVISVEESSRPSPSAEDAVEYLAWHGIEAAIHSMTSQGTGTGEALLADAHEIGAGLLIMGAYTHSRLRRMILGSVTGYMLGAADISVLLMH